MDTSTISTEEITIDSGIKIGEDSAPVKVVEFINIRCPFCKKWMIDTENMLSNYVAQGKVQRIIKLFDKEKEALQPGNIMHQYVEKKNGAEALIILNKIYATQDDWGNLASLDAVAEYAENTLGLEKHIDKEMTAKVIEEANRANIVFVPTIIINDHVFDENIHLDELATFIEEGLDK